MGNTPDCYIVSAHQSQSLLDIDLVHIWQSTFTYSDNSGNPTYYPHIQEYSEGSTPQSQNNEFKEEKNTPPTKDTNQNKSLKILKFKT
jgi:hypothetical protein